MNVQDVSQREWLLRAAVSAGWEATASANVSTFSRGDEEIDVEYSGAGIPRIIRRISANGTKTVVGQNYIRMIDVLAWLAGPEKKNG